MFGTPYSAVVRSFTISIMLLYLRAEAKVTQLEQIVLMKHILFVCSANIQRSKTAEDFFSERYSRHEFRSAGTNIKLCQKEGTNPLTEEALEAADTIFVMESKHQKWINQNSIGKHGNKIILLNIPDRFKYYQKELIQLLEDQVIPHLD